MKNVSRKRRRILRKRRSIRKRRRSKEDKKEEKEEYDIFLYIYVVLDMRECTTVLSVTVRTIRHNRLSYYHLCHRTILPSYLRTMKLEKKSSSSDSSKLDSSFICLPLLLAVISPYQRVSCLAGWMDGWLKS